MGQGSSSLPSSLPNYALHCLRVAPSSPAAGQIEPFFDYLVGVETDPPSQLIPEDGLSPVELGRVLEANEGRRIMLKIYNAKSQRIRDVQLVPSRTWVEEAMKANGEEGSSEAPDRNQNQEEGRKPSLLGLSLRVCNPARALESVYHVLDVLEGSPAEMAGLVPWGDFVIAWSGGPLHSENDFYSLIENHIDKPLRLFVYNSDLDNLREVVLYPTRQWGGEGLIGCGIGYGLLHRIPRPATPPATVFSADEYFPPASDVDTVPGRPSSGIGRTDQSTPTSNSVSADRLSGENGKGDDLFVPANMASPPTTSSTHA